MSDIEITSHGFTYSNYGYFRDDIVSILLASYGHKRDAIGPKSYLEVQNQVQRDVVKDYMRYETTATIDWDSQSRTDVDAVAFSYFTAGGKLSADWSTAREQHLRLMFFGIDKGPLQKMLNNDADGARKYLRNEGAHGRIVCGLWVATVDEVAETVAAAYGGQGKVSVAAGTADITVSASVSSKSTVTVSVGAGAFAYQLAKVTDWTSDDKVKAMEWDQYGSIEV